MAPESLSQPNAKTFTPEDIVAEVLAGRVRVPAFQRGLRWRWEDVKRLFDSIVKGYPIGNLLLWERAAPKEDVQIGSLKIDAPQGTGLFVVDGQQRVTSLANALTEEGAKDPRFALAFDLKNNCFAKLSGDNPSHVVPLYVIFDLEKLLPWFSAHPDLTPLLPSASRIAKAIRQYAIPAYVVKQQSEEVLRDIFDRMNNYGRRLSRAEIFTALHGGQIEDGSQMRFTDLAERVDAETKFGRIDDDTVLRAFLARRGGNVSRDIRIEFKSEGPTRDFGGESVSSANRKGRLALEHAIRFLQEHAGVPHFSFLPYRYLIVVLTRFFAHFPEPSSRNRTLLRRFFWRAALAGPMHFGAWTEAMRALATKITAEDESDSVQRLLAALEDHKPSPPHLDHFRTSNAETRVILCALWSLGPRSPVDGSPYAIEDLASTLEIDITAKAALRMFFPKSPHSLAANRAILLDEVKTEVDDAFSTGEDFEQFHSSTRAAILKSHALDKQMLRFLQEGKATDFLAARGARLGAVVRDFLARMTERHFEDTPPLDDLDLDEEGERDDGPA